MILLPPKILEKLLIVVLYIFQAMRFHTNLNKYKSVYKCYDEQERCTDVKPALVGITNALYFMFLNDFVQSTKC